MKLRLRSTSSKETLKIDVPSDCTLPQLKQIIAERIGIVASSSSASGSSAVTVSLNRRDELIGSPDESLQSLGVASGDLLFYAADSSVFLPQSQTVGFGSSQPVPSSDIGIVDCGNSGGLEDGKAAAVEVEGSGVRVWDEEMADSGNETLELEESGVGVEEESMVVDFQIDVNAKRRSMPHFLKNVCKEGEVVVLSGYRLWL